MRVPRLRDVCKAIAYKMKQSTKKKPHKQLLQFKLNFNSSATKWWRPATEWTTLIGHFRRCIWPSCRSGSSLLSHGPLTPTKPVIFRFLFSSSLNAQLNRYRFFGFLRVVLDLSMIINWMLLCLLRTVFSSFGFSLVIRVSSF